MQRPRGPTSRANTSHGLAGHGPCPASQLHPMSWTGRGAEPVVSVAAGWGVESRPARGRLSKGVPKGHWFSGGLGRGSCRIANPTKHLLRLRVPDLRAPLGLHASGLGERLALQRAGITLGAPPEAGRLEDSRRAHGILSTLHFAADDAVPSRPLIKQGARPAASREGPDATSPSTRPAQPQPVRPSILDAEAASARVYAMLSSRDVTSVGVVSARSRSENAHAHHGCRSAFYAVALGSRGGAPDDYSTGRPPRIIDMYTA